MSQIALWDQMINMKFQVENDLLLRFCLFRISLASILRILRLFKLIFFSGSFTSFLKIARA